MYWLMTVEKPEETGTVKSLNSILTNPCPPHIPRWLSFPASVLPYLCCVCPPRPNPGCAVCSPAKPGECSRSPTHIIPILPSPMKLVMLLLQPSQPQPKLTFCILSQSPLNWNHPLPINKTEINTNYVRDWPTKSLYLIWNKWSSGHCKNRDKLPLSEDWIKSQLTHNLWKKSTNPDCVAKTQAM